MNCPGAGTMFGALPFDARISVVAEPQQSPAGDRISIFPAPGKSQARCCSNLFRRRKILSWSRAHLRVSERCIPGWMALAVSGDTWSSAVMIDYEEQWLELRRLSQEMARVSAPPPRPAPNPVLEFDSENDLKDEVPALAP